MNAAKSGSRPGSDGRRYRRHEITLADGGRLALHPNGSIDHVAEDGSVVESWDPGHPEWAQHALRFGIRPQAVTVAPRPRGPVASRIRP